MFPDSKLYSIDQGSCSSFKIVQCSRDKLVHLLLTLIGSRRPNYLYVATNHVWLLGIAVRDDVENPSSMHKAVNR